MLITLRIFRQKQENMAFSHWILYNIVWKVCLLSAVILFNTNTQARQLELGEVQRLCYPGEYGRGDMTSISTKTPKVQEALDKLPSGSIQKLHMSVTQTNSSWEVHINSLHKLKKLNERG